MIHKEDGSLAYKEVKTYDQKSIEKKVKFFKSSTEVIDLDCKDRDIIIHGDTKFLFLDYDEVTVSGDDKMFHFWINTAFIGDDCYLKFEKKQLDKAIKVGASLLCYTYNNIVVLSLKPPGFMYMYAGQKEQALPSWLLHRAVVREDL